MVDANRLFLAADTRWIRRPFVYLCAERLRQLLLRDSGRATSGRAQRVFDPERSEARLRNGFEAGP